MAELGLLASRWLLLLAEAQIAGALVVHALVGRFALRRVLRPARWAMLVLGPVWLCLQASALVGGLAGPGQIWLVLSQTRVGEVAVTRALLWLFVAIAPRRVATPAAVLAVALHVGAGHAAASGDPVLFAASLAHVASATVWIGGLLPLLLAMRAGDAMVVARRFFWLGLGCVAPLAGTALALGADLAGGAVGLIGTGYGHVILVKVAGLGVLLALAVRNRFALGACLPGSPHALDRSVKIELAIGAAVLAAASLLSTLPPGAHVQANWPLTWRPTLAALAEPELHDEALQGILLAAGAAVLAMFALWRTRLRLPALAAAVILAWLAAPHLDLLAVPAVPTQFWEMPETADPAAGQAVYAAHCISCHKANRQGMGMASNLAAPHFWDHVDGELFWWVTDGIAGPDGQTLMPGFASLLTEDERWAVIAWLHTENPAPGVPVSGHHHHH